MMTAGHRAAAIQYGRPFRITLPHPDGASSALERSHGVFCYTLYVPLFMGTPRCGWQASGLRRRWVASGAGERLWVVSGSDRVIRVGACE